MQYTLFVILAPLAALTSSVAVIYIWRHRAAPGALALMGALIAITGWLILNTLELVDPTEVGTLLWAKLEYLFFTSAPVAWLLFALQYTGRNKWLTPRRIALLFLVPLIVSFFALTNDGYHLVWKSYVFTPINNWLAMNVVAYGPGFWVHIIYSYSMVFVGAFIIVREYFQSWKPYRQQSVWSVVGAIVPIVFNVVYVFRLIPGFRKDYSSVAYALSGLAFSMAILRYQLFDLMPVARKTLVDEMSDGVLVVDQQNRMVDMNPAAQSALGLSAGEAIAHPAAQVLPFWQSLADSLSDKTETQTEISMGQGQAQRYYDVRLSPLSDRRRRLTGRLVVLHDITARREMEEILRQANQELEARNEELDAFGHTVAHDLKGPLALIIGHAMLLADKSPVPEEQRDESIRSIAEIGVKMDSIIEELMLLAGLRKAQVEMQPLDVADIAAKVAHRLSRMIDQYQAVIDWPAASSWPWALGYGPWIEEVWVNYLSNAIKYGGRPPRVQMGAAPLPNPPLLAREGGLPVAGGGGGMVRFWVRDNGPGLSPDEQARLFVPFERLGQVRVTGYGLGLSVARRIMEKMGGQVGVESGGVPGQGSAFFFTLPAAIKVEQNAQHAIPNIQYPIPGTV